MSDKKTETMIRVRIQTHVLSGPKFCRYPVFDYMYRSHTWLMLAQNAVAMKFNWLWHIRVARLVFGNPSLIIEQPPLTFNKIRLLVLIFCLTGLP